MDLAVLPTRRHVIRQFVLGTATSWLGGAWSTDYLCAATEPLVESVGRLLVKITDFPTLAVVGGSLRLNVGLLEPILINRSAAGFHALSSRCQHNDCPVEKFNPALGYIVCNCHGSRYNIDGSLLAGPAETGLDRFEFKFDGDNTITVFFPGMTHAAREISIVSVSGNTRRLRLAFRAQVFTDYQVLYRATLSAEPQVVDFSLTPSGSATQRTYRNTNFDPNNSVPLVNLYVDAAGSTGFFSIVIPPVEV